jgi:acyl-CoA synthetase (AMP-forming)/AMP-acid ligase II
VGRPVAPNQVAIIPVSDAAIARLEDTTRLPAGETGEIIVYGPTTTDAYWQREEQTRLAKLRDAQGQTWHRMGDVGRFDEQGRLWYCGRKSQRVVTAAGTLYPDQVEAVFNAHPLVERTALVGVGARPPQRPVLWVELLPGVSRRKRQGIRDELLALAADTPGLEAIRDLLFHKAFPVDIRHNSKIGREKLASWAQAKLR